MADIPDYMRGFDLDNDWGFTPVSTPPTTEEKPTIDPKTIDNQSLELAKVKKPIILINPRITGRFGKSFFQEGCLSFKD